MNQLKKRFLITAYTPLLLNSIKLRAESFAERLKQVKLATTNDLNAVKIHAVENEEKTGKLQTFDSSYFLGKFFFR